MSKDESVWSPEKREVVDTLAESVYDALLKLAEKNAPQASAVTAERVVELERDVAAGRAREVELEQQLAQAIQDREASDAAANEQDGEHEELRQALDLLATAYVVREVPWQDVAAGMMTISSQGVPFLAESVGGDPKLEIELRGLHEGKVITFTKTPVKGETVRVLVPHVTPEQAESLVKNELGGTTVA